ncbi:hypothetical protein [Roseateles violae]|uniref:Right handed beta helix domain-containing protein n=1 Tax=Roseateles violae TaxID=3058042 RepID=A0ABT8DMV8_9BURK|nr:hypothetical protein [Pelomonas sp. PFR6]MDN3919326.1 hypothetical protein [Pelomonas sp. PFR6]
MDENRYGDPAPHGCTRRQGLQWGAALAAGLALPTAAAAEAPATLRVGRTLPIKTLAGAARQARDGMVIEVETGDYVSDVAVWTQSDLTLRAVGRVRMVANGPLAQGKAIFVCSGERMRIEGFEFVGAKTRDRNGAGVRLESGSLRLVDCVFRDNETGLLTSNDKNARLEIENCDFGAIVRREGQTHNLYVGEIAQLKVSGSYFHHGQLGHLLKSRAAVNHIFYNRLSDEIGGEASYELEFPNGGQALVVGNLIQQSSTTQNPQLISFGSEGYTWPRQELQLINNTLVDRLPSGGIYLRVAPGPAQVRVLNNVLAGNPYFASNGYWEQRNNFIVDWDAFVLAARDDYSLRPDSPLRGKAIDPGRSGELALLPSRQYKHPCGTLALSGPARHPGAFQQP